MESNNTADATSKVIERLVNEGVERTIQERNRVIGQCYHCRKSIFGSQHWREELIVYNPVDITLENGLFHRACIPEYLKGLAKSLVLDIKSRDSSYRSIISLIAKKNEPDNDVKKVLR